MQNETISELYTDDKKVKYSSNPNDVLKSVKTFMKIFMQRRERPKILLLNILLKFLTERKYHINNFNIVWVIIFKRMI